MYLINVIREILNWIRVYKIVKANEETLKKYSIRIDWIGRMYTVMNLPEEIANNEYAKEPHVIANLRKYDEILLNLQLTELVFPDMIAIPNTASYLLVMHPEVVELTWTRIIGHTILYAIMFFVLRTIYNVIASNTELTSTISEFFSTYVFK